MGTCYDDIACLLLTHESSRWDQQYSHAVRLRDHRLRKLKLGVVSEFSHLVRSFSCSAVLSTDPPGSSYSGAAAAATPYPPLTCGEESDPTPAAARAARIPETSIAVSIPNASI